MPTPITTTAASRRRACTAATATTRGYANSATGFATNVAYSTNGGSDTAYFFDSPGNDTYYAYADYNGTRQAGGGHVRQLRRRVRQLGQRLRHERRLLDQRRQRHGLFLRFAGQRHVLCLRRLQQQRQAVGGHVRQLRGYANSATGFATNVGNATYGSGDTAYFEIRAGNDTFYAYANYLSSGQTYAGMNGSGYANLAKGFSTMIGTATYGTGDVADLYDSRGNDALYTDAAIAQLYGGNYSEQASDFSVVNAFGTMGGVNTHTAGPDAVSYQLRLDGTWVS